MPPVSIKIIVIIKFIMDFNVVFFFFLFHLLPFYVRLKFNVQEGSTLGENMV
jgi:hypothetical protein